ncbi:MAG: heterodisulfide reductase-related iron-sulfur binding cluster [Myxococcota bacterium]
MSASEEAPVCPPIRRGWDDIYEGALDCVHCGLCLTSCPTYRATGRESSSPRGRIYLMRGIAEQRVPLGELARDEAHLCLGCRACETACPSGVQYGAMLERTREEVRLAGLREDWPARIERFLLRHLVPHRARLGLAFDLLAFAQRLGLDRAVGAMLPPRLREAQALLPRVPSRAERRTPPTRIPAQGQQRGRVGFLRGCVMSEAFADINAATLRVLARNGLEVVVPDDQGCCGALQAHAGDRDTAVALARVNLGAFAEVDTVVTNSAGCGAALCDAGHWMPGEGEPLAKKSRDVCAVLDEVGLRPPDRRIEARVCYDDPCHLVHGQRVADAPRRLLAQIPGLRLTEHAEPTACCGAAGTYNLTQPEMSQAVLARKMDALAAADPDLIVTGNPGCLMQLRAGATARGLRAEVLHPVELLDRAYSR